MTDQDRLGSIAPTEATAPTDLSLASPLLPVPTARPELASSVSSTGRTPGRTRAVRAGMIVGTGLLVVLGAAVAMAASPSPSTSSGAAPTASGRPDGAGRGPHGVPFGGFGPGGFGPGGSDGQAHGRDGRGRGGFRGFGDVSVTAVAGSNVSLATEDGWTRTIAVTSSTKVTKGGAAATVADLAVGDTVRIAETRNADGTYAITSLDIVQPQVAGTVTALTADTVTITVRDGTSTTIRTTGTTTYHVEDADGKRSDVSVGAAIVASGERAADGSLTASGVWIRLPHVAGIVAATSATSITIARRDGTTVVVHVGADATIRVLGIDSAKLSDVKTGMGVVVEGAQRADGSIDARAIGAGDPGKGKDHLKLPKGTDGAPPAPAPAATGSPEG